jgi:hypothetical protein
MSTYIQITDCQKVDHSCCRQKCVSPLLTEDAAFNSKLGRLSPIEFLNRILCSNHAAHIGSFGFGLILMTRRDIENKSQFYRSSVRLLIIPSPAGLPDISRHHIPKQGKIYQNVH